MRVIGMLLGVPEADQAAVRDGIDAKLRTEAGKPLAVEEGTVPDRGQFDDYIDWRAEQPSNYIMTNPLNDQLGDVTGPLRRVARVEPHLYTSVTHGAGTETTRRPSCRVGK